MHVRDICVMFYRGQSYDGAGNMAGSVRGAAARIKALYPLATYVHCSSHQLNLCVMKACSIQVFIHSYTCIIIVTVAT